MCHIIKRQLILIYILTFFFLIISRFFLLLADYCPDWIKSKKSTINLVNDDYKCFHYATTLALNNNRIGKNSQIISKIKSFINKYKKLINKHKKINPAIALNVLYVIITNIYFCLHFKTQLKS